MLELIDIEQINNIIKYYQFVKDSTQFKQDEIIDYPGFSSIECYYEDNIDSWHYNKKHIFKLFGEKLKIKQPLKEEAVCTPELVNSLKTDFLEEKGKELHVLIEWFIAQLRPEEILKNKLERDIEFLDIKFKSGARITRCFDRLEEDSQELSRQQDLYSVFLQSLKIKGNLVLSIDPIDYITMSVSRSGWSSCHHPTSCHGLGGVAYMNDEATIIAYVETEQPMINYIYDEDSDETHKIEMPNKIWRQIVNINYNHDYALQMKGYPNASELYESAVSRVMKKLLEQEQNDRYIVEGIDLHDGYIGLQQASQTLEGEVFYCDFLQNNMDYLTGVFRSKYESLDNLENEIEVREVSIINIGAPVSCACGCGWDNYTESFYIEEGSGDEYYY